MVSVGWAQGSLWGTQGCLGGGSAPTAPSGSARQSGCACGSSAGGSGQAEPSLGSPQPHGTLQCWGRGAGKLGKAPGGAGDSPGVPRCLQANGPGLSQQMAVWKLAVSKPPFKLLNAFSSVKTGLI